MFKKFLIATAVLVLSAPAVAQPYSKPITIGVSYHSLSKALGEERTFNVVLPPSYEKEPAKRYPVLYLIDGGLDQDLLHVAGAAQLGAIWGRSAEVIVVGVATNDRRRELSGPISDPELLKRYPTVGSSESFRAFIRHELKPFIERSYRTNERDVVLGESLAGLFIVETFLAEPGLFDAYAAIDPSLWWDKEALSRTIASRIGDRKDNPRLYLAMAKEQAEKPAGINRLVSVLKTKADNWCLAERPDLLHSTIYQQMTPQALQFLLPPSEAPPAEFGFEVQCSKKF